MKDTYLIGITGRAGCGKDTLAGMLDYATYAFAGPLKAGLAAMGFPEPPRLLKEERIEGFSFSWRRAAQLLGTEWGRALQSDIWLAMAKRHRCDVQAEFLVITDVRFHNEADWIREHGILVHLRGRQTLMTDPAAAQHESENLLPVMEQDYVIENSGSLNRLRQLTHGLRNHIAGL